MKTIKAKRNIWGNIGLFIGTEKVRDTAEEWLACEWLAEQLETGLYKLSDKTDFHPVTRGDEALALLRSLYNDKGLVSLMRPDQVRRLEQFFNSF